MNQTSATHASLLLETIATFLRAQVKLRDDLLVPMLERANGTPEPADKNTNDSDAPPEIATPDGHSDAGADTGADSEAPSAEGAPVVVESLFRDETPAE